jgi:hypothetical protein
MRVVQLKLGRSATGRLSINLLHAVILTGSPGVSQPPARNCVLI